MTTITLEIPVKEVQKVEEYKKIFTSFIRKYPLERLKQINWDISPLYWSWEVVWTKDHNDFLEILKNA